MLQQAQKSYLYPLAVMLAVFTILASLAGALLIAINANRASEQRMNVSVTTAVTASAIERQITHKLSATYALAIALKQTGGSGRNFTATAAELMQLYRGIHSLQLAPMGVIRYVYPLAGNETALGHNLLQDPRQRAEALKAIQSRTGPFDLPLAGRVIVGRLPIYLPKPSGGERFWGFTIAVIELDELFGQIDLQAIFGPDYAYCLYRLDPITEDKYIIASSNSDKLNNAVEVEITAPNTKWILAVKPMTAWGPPLPWVIWLITFILCLPIAFMAYIIVKQNKKIATMALHDALTGLPNRVLFNERAKLAMAQARRHKKRVALIFIDVDNFKMVNDLFGHDAGDQLLCLLSERLSGCVRDIDTLARIGGDEFLLILSQLDKGSDAERITQKLKKVVEKPFLLDSHEIGISISLGMSLYPSDGGDLAVLKSKADTAMYRDKNRDKMHSTK